MEPDIEALPGAGEAGTGDRRHATEGRRQEAGGRRQKSGGGRNASSPRPSPPLRDGGEGGVFVGR
jgi:hypothetical protein